MKNFIIILFVIFGLSSLSTSVLANSTKGKPSKSTTTQTASTPSSQKSTGRTTPKNLHEQLAMEAVKANPKGTTPARMPPMSDTKNGWLAKDGWVKRVQNQNGVEIHYIENTNTGEKTDFKFKD